MNEKIFLTDDDENVISGYKRNLRGKYEILSSNNPNEGLEIIKKDSSIAVVVSDFRMPEMDGVTYLQKIKNINPDIVRILLTGHADAKTSIDAVNKGNIFRLLTKPCSSEDLISTLDSALEQYKLIISERELLNKTLNGAIKILIDILGAVNPVAFSRSSRLKNIAKKIAERMHVEPMWEVEMAAMLSQIGCVAIPQDILQKKYRDKPLSINENELYMSHPEVGRSLLSNIPRFEKIAKSISLQLKCFKESDEENHIVSEDEIPLLARILKVINDFDTYTEAGKQVTQAIKMMHADSWWYDPKVLYALEAEISNLGKGFILRSVYINEITPGMRLAENIVDKNGFNLLTKGTEISQVLLFKLKNFIKLERIEEPIKILEESN